MADGNIKLGVDLIFNKSSVSKVRQEFNRLDLNLLNGKGQAEFEKRYNKLLISKANSETALDNAKENLAYAKQELDIAQKLYNIKKKQVAPTIKDLKSKTGRQIFKENMGYDFPQDMRMPSSYKKQKIADAQKELEPEKSLYENKKIVYNDAKAYTKEKQAEYDEKANNLKYDKNDIVQELLKDYAEPKTPVTTTFEDMAKVRATTPEAPKLTKDEQTVSQYTALENTISQIKESIANGTGDIQLQKQVLVQLTEQYKALGTEMDKIAKKQKALDMVKNIAGKVSGVMGKVGGALKGPLSAAGEKVGEAFGSAKEKMSSLGGKAVDGVKKGVGGLFKGMASASMGSVKSIGNATKKLKGFMKTGVKLLFGVRSVYMLIRRLRQVFVNALNTIATQSPEFNAELSKTKTLLEGLKGSLGTMLQPLISAVLPTINSVISGLTTAFEKMGSVFASLSGQDYVYKATANWQDYSAAVAGANKKLGAYDKLNTLGNNNNTLDVNYSKEKIDGGVADLMAKIKEAWNNSDFTDIGTMLGEKLKSGLDFLNTNIIPKIDETGTKLGASVGTLITGIVQVPELGISLGETVAGLLNAAVHTIEAFFANTDFRAVGTMLGDAINSLFTDFDWAALARTVSDWITALPKLVIGLIEQIDWSLVVDKIWEFVANIKWGDLAETAMELLGSALAAAVQLVVGLVKKIGGWIIEGFKDGLWAGLANIGMWIYEHIFKPFIDGIKKVFGIASPSKVMKELSGFIVEGFLLPLSELPTKVTEWFTKVKDKVVTFMGELKTKIKTAITGIKDTVGSIFRSMIEVIKKPINAIIGVINGLIKGIVGGINKLITSLNSFNIKVPNWVTKLTGVTSFGFNFKTLNVPQIPLLAQGAVIPPNREFLAMLGDQTSGTNIEAPLDTIKQAVAEVLGNGGGQPIILQVDGKTLAKVVWSENEKRYKQVGKTYAY